MNRHELAVGQIVSFMPGPGDLNVPPGKYEIQRLLPSETKDNQYRVKHSGDGHERVVPESKLVALSDSLGLSSRRVIRSVPDIQ
jgi:hypothetical protein